MITNDLQFCPVLARLYEAESIIGRSGKPFTLLGGRSTKNNLAVIRKLLLDHRPVRTLEVGMACGGSTLTFAATLRDIGQEPCKQHVAIDAFQTRGFDDVGRILLEKAKLDGYVDVRERLSSYDLASRAEAGELFDLIYIDG